jgi:hypothetical protein
MLVIQWNVNNLEYMIIWTTAAYCLDDHIAAINVHKLLCVVLA